jgi:hypothetical protein
LRCLVWCAFSFWHISGPEGWIQWARWSVIETLMPFRHKLKWQHSKSELLQYLTTAL